MAYAVDYWSLMFAELDAAGIHRPPDMGHADLFETSILLATRPELVRMDLAEPDKYRDPLPPGVDHRRGSRMTVSAATITRPRRPRD